jgi:hypothetical protein
MGKELKLELGKLYETRDENVVFIYRISGGRYLGSVRYGGCYEWEKDGTSSGNNCREIIRCLDDETGPVDLTKIDVPFGELCERTQDRLAGAYARGVATELSLGDRWIEPSRPVFDIGLKYRLKPENPAYTMPTVDDKVWLALPGAKSFTWDSGATNPYAHAKSNPDKVEHYGQWIDGDELPANLFGDLIQRGDCPWHMAIVLRPEGL